MCDYVSSNNFLPDRLLGTTFSGVVSRNFARQISIASGLNLLFISRRTDLRVFPKERCNRFFNGQGPSRRSEKYQPVCSTTTLDVSLRGAWKLRMRILCLVLQDANGEYRRNECLSQHAFNGSTHDIRHLLPPFLMFLGLNSSLNHELFETVPLTRGYPVCR